MKDMNRMRMMMDRHHDPIRGAWDELRRLGIEATGGSGASELGFSGGLKGFLIGGRGLLRHGELYERYRMDLLGFDGGGGGD